MNLERDLEYSERSRRGKGILIIISIILAVMFIASLISIGRVKEERDTIRQQLTTLQKEKEILQQRIEDLKKENEALKHQVASITEDRDRLAKELASKKVTLPKKARRK